MVVSLFDSILFSIMASRPSASHSTALPSDLRAPNLSSSPAVTTLAPKRLRTLDAFLQLPENLPSSNELLPSTLDDCFIPTSSTSSAHFVPTPSTSSGSHLHPNLLLPSHPTTSASHLHAINMLHCLPLQSDASNNSNLLLSRQIAPLPRRASKSPVIELMDSEDEEDRPPCDSPQYVYKLNPRLTTHGWQGQFDPTTWVLSHDYLHTDQVLHDQALLGHLGDFPTYVSLFLCFLLSSFFILFQGFSSGDLQLLHQYLMSRYEVDSIDDYVHLLCLFRNTWASKEIEEISSSVEITCLSIKGAPGLESQTRPQLFSPGNATKKSLWTTLQLGSKTLI